MVTAVIFDLDGLLADTEPLQMQAYQQVLSEHGVALTDDEYAHHWIRAGWGIEEFVASRQLSLIPATVRCRTRLLDCGKGLPRYKIGVTIHS